MMVSKVGMHREVDAWKRVAGLEDCIALLKIYKCVQNLMQPTHLLQELVSDIALGDGLGEALFAALYHVCLSGLALLALTFSFLCQHCRLGFILQGAVGQASVVGSK